MMFSVQISYAVSTSDRERGLKGTISEQALETYLMTNDLLWKSYGFNSHLGGIHKLRHTLRADGGGRRNVTLCDKGEGGILNFVTSHFKNSIKATLHVLTKLKQFH